MYTQSLHNNMLIDIITCYTLHLIKFHLNFTMQIKLQPNVSQSNSNFTKLHSNFIKSRSHSKSLMIPSNLIFIQISPCKSNCTVSQPGLESTNFEVWSKNNNKKVTYRSTVKNRTVHYLPNRGDSGDCPPKIL